MKNLKRFVMIIVVVVFAAAMSVTAFASVSTIKSVSIKISETKEEEGTIWTAVPTVSSSYYEIESYTWSRDYDEWTAGSKITLTVNLVTTGEREFASRSSLSYSVTNGDKASLTRESATRLKVKIYYYPKVTLESPDGLQYDEDTFTVSWDKVSYAGGYEVKLYKNGSASSFETLALDGKSNNTLNVSSYVTGGDEITLAVRAVAADSKTDYIKSSAWVYLDDEIYTSDDNTVYGSFTGSGSSLRFYDDEGSYATGWQYINGNRYYFDPGTYYAVTGWLQLGGCWYYFDGDGKMQTGWQYIDGYWYYMDPDTESAAFGMMQTGWIRTAPLGPWYYLNTGAAYGYPYGAMLSETTTPDGYYVNASGEWNG